MKFNYKENGTYELNELIELYKSVGWVGYTDQPEKIKKAVENSLFNIGAFYADELIGLIRVVGDGTSIIYIQDILIKEKYQGLGIGSHLLQSVLEKYEHIRQIVLLTDNTEKTIAFYEKNGMSNSTKFHGIAFVKYNFKA